MSIEVHEIEIKRNHGFFSDFLTIIAGILFCKNNNFKYIVNWENNRYGENKENLFNKYFYQEKYNGDYIITNTYKNVTPLGYYFPEHVDFTNNTQFYNHYLEPSNAIKNDKILDSNTFKEINLDYFKGKKVLGVHKRGTDHGLHGHILSDEFFFEKIDNYLETGNFDNIFLITDDFNSFNSFMNRYGDILLHTDSYMNNTQVGLHSLGNLDKNKLCLDVIRDAYLLSMTDFKIVTKSNVSTFSLLCNLKEDNFIYIDNHIKYA